MNFYIFLDIDGVLNHSKTPGWQRTDHSGLVLDDGCVSNYLKLLERLRNSGMNLKIVLSSTWRLVPKARDYLREHGIFWDDVTIGRLSSRRDFEIGEYIVDNKLDAKDCLILDDACTASLWGSTLVSTDFATGGFTDLHLEKAVNLALYRKIALDYSTEPES